MNIKTAKRWLLTLQLEQKQAPKIKAFKAAIHESLRKELSHSTLTRHPVRVTQHI